MKEKKSNTKVIADVFKNNRDIVFGLDLNGCFDYVSLAFEHELGYSASEVIGKDVDCFIDESEILRLNAFFKGLEARPNIRVLKGLKVLNKLNQIVIFDIEIGRIDSGYIGLAVKVNKTQQEQIEPFKDFKPFFFLNLDLMAIINQKSAFMHLSPEWANTLETSLESIKEQTLFSFIHEADQDYVKERIMGASDKIETLFCRLITDNNTYKYVNLRFKEHASMIYLSAHDLTEHYHHAQKLKKEHNFLSTTLQSLNEAVITTGPNGDIIMINTIAKDLTGCIDEAYIGKNIKHCLKLYDMNNQEITSVFETVISSKSSMRFKQARLQLRDDSYITVRITLSPIVDDAQLLLGLVLVFTDIEEELNYLKQIEYLSYHDALTTFYNRHYFEKVKDDIMVSSNLPLCCISIDINGLKNVNDLYGHSEGDKLIKDAAKILKEAVSDHHYLFRMGGDEFIVFLPNTTDDEAYALRKRIHALIKTVNNPYLDLAYGYHTVHDLSENIFQVMQTADYFMYQNKRKYKQ